MRFRGFAKSGAQRLVNYLVEGHVELAGMPLQDIGNVIIDRERSAHSEHLECARKGVKALDLTERLCAADKRTQTA
jgi:hypothetical protein